MPSIAFRDFGPIARAEVDLKPLTVLIGSNNTGKSYLALAIYAFWRVISDAHFGGVKPLQPRVWSTLPRLNRNSIRRWKQLLRDTPEVRHFLSGTSRIKDVA